MNKLGIFMNFWENTWEADHAKYIRKAAVLGFDVLEFQAQALLNMSYEKMTELKTLADDCHIELTYSLGLDPAFDISSPDSEIRKAGMHYLSSIMERVAFMGGKIISGVSYAGWGIPSGEINREERWKNSISSMMVLAKKAEEYGITYGVEVVNRFEGVVLNTAAQAVQYVREVDSPNVGVLLDTYHMNIEEPSIGDAIRLVGDKLVGFHIGENNRTCPGRGHLDWNEIFTALKDVNYQGRIVAELFVSAGGEVGRSIGVWHDLMPDLSESALDEEALRLIRFEKEMMKKVGM